MPHRKPFVCLPHDIVQAMIVTRLTGSEIQLLMTIMALTLGFNTEKKQISTAYFARATGLSKTHVCDLLKRMAERHIILVEKVKRANQMDDTSFYQLNQDCEAWQSTGHKTPSATTAKGYGVYRQRHHGCANSPEAEPLQTDSLNEVQFVPDFKSTPFPISSTLYKETSINKNINTTSLHSTKKSKKEEELLSQFIKNAARDYQMIIVGSNVTVLQDLLKIQDYQSVYQALQHFHAYQLQPAEKRRFKLSSDFRTFVRKIDCFLSVAAMEARLLDEKRWYQEECARQVKEYGHGRVSWETETSTNEQSEESVAAFNEQVVYFKACQTYNKVKEFTHGNHQRIPEALKYYRIPLDTYWQSVQLVRRYFPEEDVQARGDCVLPPAEVVTPAWIS